MFSYSSINNEGGVILFNSQSVLFLFQHSSLPSIPHQSSSVYSYVKVKASLKVLETKKQHVLLPRNSVFRVGKVQLCLCLFKKYWHWRLLPPQKKKKKMLPEKKVTKKKCLRGAFTSTSPCERVVTVDTVTCQNECVDINLGSELQEQNQWATVARLPGQLFRLRLPTVKDRIVAENKTFLQTSQFENKGFCFYLAKLCMRSREHWAR